MGTTGNALEIVSHAGEAEGLKAWRRLVMEHACEDEIGGLMKSCLPLRFPRVPLPILAVVLDVALFLAAEARSVFVLLCAFRGVLLLLLSFDDVALALTCLCP